MADSETQQLVDSTQQVTSKTPATKQKNPKRVAAGKAIAQKNETGTRGAEKKLLSRHRSSLQMVKSKMLTHHLWLNQWLNLWLSQWLNLWLNQWLNHRKLKAPKTILQQHNGLASSAF